MSRLELLVLGVGDAFSECYRPSSFLLRLGDFYLAIDCPDAYRRALLEASRAANQPLHLDDIDHFLITHLHGDHVNGLEAVAFYKRFYQKKRAKLVTIQAVVDEIWSGRLQASMGALWDGKRSRAMSFDDYFELLTLDQTRKTRVGPFELEIRMTRHHIPTFAFLLQGGGRTLGYSADTAFDPSLIDFLSSADLIIHETNLGPAHTPYSALEALPSTLCQRMRLIHYPDGFDTTKSAIQVLREGQLLEV